MTPQTEIQLVSILNTFMMAYISSNFPDEAGRAKLIEKLGETHEKYLESMKKEFPGL